MGDPVPPDPNLPPPLSLPPSSQRAASLHQEDKQDQPQETFAIIVEGIERAVEQLTSSRRQISILVQQKAKVQVQDASISKSGYLWLKTSNVSDYEALLHLDWSFLKPQPGKSVRARPAQPKIFQPKTMIFLRNVEAKLRVEDIKAIIQVNEISVDPASNAIVLFNKKYPSSAFNAKVRLASSSDRERALELGTLKDNKSPCVLEVEEYHAQPAVNLTCFKCFRTGHIARYCEEMEEAEQKCRDCGEPYVEGHMCVQLKCQRPNCGGFHKYADCPSAKFSASRKASFLAAAKRGEASRKRWVANEKNQVKARSEVGGHQVKALSQIGGYQASRSPSSASFTRFPPPEQSPAPFIDFASQNPSSTQVEKQLTQMRTEIAELSANVNQLLQQSTPPEVMSPVDVQQEEAPANVLSVMRVMNQKFSELSADINSQLRAMKREIALFAATRDSSVAEKPEESTDEQAAAPHEQAAAPQQIEREPSSHLEQSKQPEQPQLQCEPESEEQSEQDARKRKQRPQLQSPQDYNSPLRKKPQTRSSTRAREKSA